MDKVFLTVISLNMRFPVKGHTPLLAKVAATTDKALTLVEIEQH
jgi:hypothetical protein